MTTLLYRGHSYQQRAGNPSSATQLRYDRSVFAERQQNASNEQMLCYRGCSYSSQRPDPVLTQGDFCYRGVRYHR